jgi:putative zinc finger/helix-turn-helix YgiT family protein
MICPECRRKMAESMEVYHYTESGLDNVYLDSLCVRQCECGEKIVSIPKIIELNSLIGRMLIKKHGPLTGKEIVFLRKNVGLSAVSFARALGIDKATLSRWENDSRSPKRGNDTFIRLLYATNKNIPQEDRDALRESAVEEFSRNPDFDMINIPVNKISGLPTCGICE